MTEKKTGLAFHCHHDVMLEYVYDFEKRENYISIKKAKGEREIRLKLFKLLPPEALAESPPEVLEAYQRLEEAVQKWEEADQTWKEADQKWKEAYQRLEEAVQKWDSKEAVHAKWCGCKEWNGSEIVFWRR